MIYLPQTAIEYAERAINERLVIRRFSPPASVELADQYLRKPRKVAPASQVTRKAKDLTIDAIINSMAIDRHDTIVDPRGMDATHFINNPVLQYQHGCDTMIGDRVVGLVRNLDMHDEYVGATVEFDGQDEFAVSLASKYKRGFMKAFSIGFIARAFCIDNMVGEATGPDGKPQQTNKEVLRYTAWDLVELSCVAVPSNPEALAA